jgi:N-acetylmuramoyl-L-alanine amidase
MPTVKEFANGGGCLTGGLRGLNNQILALLRPTVEDIFVSCEDVTTPVVGPSTIPFLQRAAKEALARAVADKGEKPRLVHAYRTVAQQYVLRRWFLTGMCGITAARPPGSSPHERGAGIDLREDPQEWRGVLEDHDWRWAGLGDPGHFTYVGDGVDMRLLKEGVRAFQRLWNLNNPNDRIDEDGIFGEIQTGPRLLRSPVEGFPS